MTAENSASWWTGLIIPALIAVMLIYSLATGCLPLRGWRIYRSEEPFSYWFMMAVGAVFLALTLIFRRQISG